MPHVVVEGPVALEAYFRAFEPLLLREGDAILKTTDAYLDTRRTTLLLAAVVVEHGRRQNFYVQLLAKDKGVTVRLEPLTDPEKTPGVLRLLAAVAADLRARSPGARFGRHNLGELLEN